jgi:hypothetical protein
VTFAAALKLRNSAMAINALSCFKSMKTPLKLYIRKYKCCWSGFCYLEARMTTRVRSMQLGETDVELTISYDSFKAESQTVVYRDSAY